MNKGLTIIESVISIFILSLGVIGAFNAFSIMSIFTSDATNRLTATYLAQEGMEITRNLRDTNWILMDQYGEGSLIVPTWSNGLTNFVDNEIGPNCESGCHADYTYNEMLPGQGSYLKINTKGFYSYNDCPAENPNCQTKFMRKITITHVPDIANVVSGVNPSTYHILKVTTEVFWDRKANILDNGLVAETDGCTSKNCVTTEETLYNWYNTDVFVTGLEFEECGPLQVIPLDLSGTNTQTLTVKVLPSYATNYAVTWSSNDDNEVGVEEIQPVRVETVGNVTEAVGKALVVAKSMVSQTNTGQVVITATSSDGLKTAQCAFTVSDSQP